MGTHDQLLQKKLNDNENKKDKLFSEKALNKNSDLLSQKLPNEFDDGKTSLSKYSNEKKLKFNIIYYLVYLKIINLILS